MEKLTPRGLIRPEDAIMEIAEKLQPDLWAEGSMPREEESVWFGINIDFDGPHLIEMLDALQCVKPNPVMRHRQRAFFSSMDILRQWLHSGAVLSCFYDPFGYIDLEKYIVANDENGSCNFDLEGLTKTRSPIPIERTSWATASQILLSGTVIDAAGRPNLVFLDSQSFAQCLADGLAEYSPPSDASAQLGSTSDSVKPNADAYRTGAPGRPSPISFVELEFERRCLAGRVAAKLKDEAAWLASWCKLEHPNIACPTKKSIENRIRVKFAAHKAAKATQL